MRNLLSFFILFFPALIFGQVVKTAAVPYTKGAGFTPNIAGSSELRVDTTTSGLFWWDRDALTWIRFRPGVDVITGSSAPAYTPRDNQSLFAVNADGELWYYNGSTWVAPVAGGVNLGNSDLVQDDAEREFAADSTQIFWFGQFPNGASLAFDGTEKGFMYDPSGDGITIMGGDGENGGYSYINLFDNSTSQFLEYGSEILSVGQVFTENNTRATRSNFLKAVSHESSQFGELNFTISQDNDDESYFRFYNIAADTNVSAMLNFGTGAPDLTRRALSVSTDENFYWLLNYLPNDTTENAFSIYNQKYKFPNKFPNQTTAISDSTFLIAWKRNGTGPYDYTPIFVSKPMIGSGGSGGIYGGSGGVPDGTVATLVDDFEFTGPDISSFTVSTGTTNGGQYFQNLAGATVLHRDTTGSSSLAFSGTGALFSFGDGATDRLTIGGRDARYSADYSGTYSARSLIDKGYADVSYISDADWTTGFSSATQATSSWTATNATTNVNAAIVPKGTGAFALAVPDGTTTGGDARGANAVDLQTSRSASTQVASGTRAIVIGGRRNTASGTQAIAIGNINTASGTGGAAFGSSNTASGTNSLALGNAATASASYAVALGGNGAAGPTASGDNSFAVGVGSTASAENTVALGAATASEKNAVALGASASLYGEIALTGTSFLSFSAKTVTGTSATEIFLDALDTKRALISSGRTWQFEVTVYARASVIGNGSVVIGDMLVATYAGVLRNVGGTTTILGTVQTLMSPQSDATMSDVVFSITADDTNDALKITYTAGASSGTTTQAQVSAVVKICKF